MIQIKIQVDITTDNTYVMESNWNLGERNTR